MVTRRFFCCLLMACLAASAVAKEYKLAVLGGPGTEEAAAIATTALSAQSGIVLMERTQLDAIVREKGLVNLLADPAAAGQILGVDALVVLEQSPDGAFLSSRLLAVQAGLVADEFVAKLPIEDFKGWGEILARRFSTAAANIPTGTQPKSLIALLGLRSTTREGRGSSIESQSTFLTSRALVHLPGVFVLDRTRLRDSDWEKSLSQGKSSPYWSSAWLLDGSINEQNGVLSFAGRLQSMQGAESRSIAATGSTTVELSEKIVEAVARELKVTTPSAPAADPATEGRLFYDEAKWALRWYLHAQAEQAVDAAWALGQRSEEIGLFRARIPLIRSMAENSFGGVFFSDEPKPDTLAMASRSLANLRDLDRLAERRPIPLSEAYLETLTEIMKNLTVVLQIYYYLPRERTDQENETLREIRAQIRTFIPLQLANADRAWPASARLKHQNLSWDEWPLHFYILYGWYASLWSDTPKESARAVFESIHAIKSMPLELHERVIDPAFLSKGRDHRPIVVSWTVDGRAEVKPLRDEVLRELRIGDGTDWVIGSGLHLQRFYSFLNKKPLEMEAKVMEVMTDFSEDCWNRRQQVVDGTISPKLFADLMGLSENISNDFPAVKQVMARLRWRMFCYQLESLWKADQESYGILFRPEGWSLEEQRQVARLIQDFQARDPSAPRFLNNYIEQLAPPAPPSGEKRIALQPARSWTFKPIKVLPTDHGCWVRGVRDVTYIDTRTLQEREFPGPWPSGNTFVADEQFFYFLSNDKVMKFNQTDRSSSENAVPVGAMPDLTMIDDQLYASGGGAIYQIDPSSLKTDLLASSRRRPAQTILDDREPNEGSVSPVKLPTGEITFGQYVWQPHRRDFVSREFHPNQKPGHIDRATLRALVGPAENQLYGGGADQPTHYLILADFNGDIRTYKDPQKLRLNGDEKFPSSTSAGAVAGTRLYVLFYGGLDRDFYLKIMDDATRLDITMPIDLRVPPEDKRVNRQTHFASNADGILIGIGDQIHFYSRQDIDAFVAARR